jgi:hypothetical protein
MILCLITADKVSIYSKDWKPFLNGLNPDNIKAKTAALDNLFKNLAPFDRQD